MVLHFIDGDKLNVTSRDDISEVRKAILIQAQYAMLMHRKSPVVVNMDTVKYVELGKDGIR